MSNNHQINLSDQELRTLLCALSVASRDHSLSAEVATEVNDHAYHSAEHADIQSLLKVLPLPLATGNVSTTGSAS